MSIAVVNIVASLNEKLGGPSRSIPGLCDAVSACGVDVTLVSQRLQNECAHNLLIPSNPEIRVQFIDAIQRFNSVYTSQYGKKLETLLSKSQCNLVHSHGIWCQCNYHAAACARRLQIPHIVSARGMMEPWAFGHKSWKKKPMWWLWQRRALQQAAAFCATSYQEADNIRRLGFSQPIAIIPNGIDLPDIKTPFKHSPCGERFALFLSRIHPKKGLCELVRSWSQLRPVGWKMVIAGPDENGHKAAVQNEIAALGLQDVFVFVGAVAGKNKERLYRDASLFILPSFSENFGISVAEALAAGTPVITTKGTPWSELVIRNCGWWVDIGVKPLAEAIRQATALSDAERCAMGQRGKEYVMSEFGWQEIGQKMFSFYEWILKGDKLPKCVKLD